MPRDGLIAFRLADASQRFPAVPHFLYGHTWAAAWCCFMA